MFLQSQFRVCDTVDHEENWFIVIEPFQKACVCVFVAHKAANRAVDLLLFHIKLKVLI